MQTLRIKLYRNPKKSLLEKEQGRFCGGGKVTVMGGLEGLQGSCRVFLTKVVSRSMSHFKLYIYVTVSYFIIKSEKFLKKKKNKTFYRK